MLPTAGLLRGAPGGDWDIAGGEDRAVDRKATEASLSLCSEAAELMRNLVDHLLDLAAIRSGKLRLTKETGELGPVGAQRVALAEFAAETKQVRTAADLKEVAKASFDRQRLAQVVGNLLDSALDFSPPGGTVRVIGFSVRADSKAVRGMLQAGAAGYLPLGPAFGDLRSG